jgi:hypothetical protein
MFGGDEDRPLRAVVFDRAGIVDADQAGASLVRRRLPKSQQAGLSQSYKMGSRWANIHVFRDEFMVVRQSLMVAVWRGR